MATTANSRSGDDALAGCLAGLLAIVLVVGGIAWAINSARDDQAKQAKREARERIVAAVEPNFQRALKSYYSTKKLTPQAVAASRHFFDIPHTYGAGGLPPKFAGKLIVIDADHSTLEHRIFGGLRASLRATKPSEVAYVVWVRRTLSDAGQRLFCAQWARNWRQSRVPDHHLDDH